MKLDLEDDFVFSADINVNAARNDELFLEAISDTLDEAQAKVFAGDAKVSYLVIKITA